ncbi:MULTISPECIES: TIGR03936 family radical SAM-associated protein [Pimelobacter]|uniref:TIGR03936 family radical SAM-associated protein n=1 Tax=Pimelobacter TaxID=2044 RepID=UPI001C0448B7|nr:MULTISPECIES: TIGR03936 family radical SAM-associated protein [Pimelobacter]MBU2696337.1 radical SAM protein [Pimelobacter sp. 30-1]UUW89481.1 TIGR03936 family radical SAM-associated protein [Pimelobacter simplex]UUW93310.1 TIGR03936 family radical SAM-associated protein [Pimelobacter simplex]
MSRQQPEQQAPPVQKLRIRYAKRGRLRFTSHRDVSRAIERAVVRARIPMAYSSGFHPHPRISYAGASPTGAASESEYVELGLAEVREPAEIGAALDAVLPDGLDVVTIVDAADTAAGSLSDLLTASHWLIDLGGVPVAEVRAAVEGFLATESVTVERMTKKGMRSFDCRAAVVRLGVAESGELDLLLEHAVPAVRPDDVLTGLREVGGLAVPGTVLLTRLAQGVLDREAGTVGDPLAAR